MSRLTREEVARRVHWPLIIWIAGFGNVVAMLSQLLYLVKTREHEGLDLSMIVIFFIVQLAFVGDGYFKRNHVLLVCMALSAVVSASVILVTLNLRNVI